MTAILSVRDLSVHFGGIAALSGLSLDVAQGHAHGLIGPNGAGKTTAFNLISGLYRQSQGSIALDGARLEGLPTWERAAAGLARTFQNIRMFGEMTVLENVMTGSHLTDRASLLSVLTRTGRFWRRERQSAQRAIEILEFVGLVDHAQRLGGDLSYGDQRRLEIARALANDPKLLMLDEPAAGMNPNETRALEKLLLALKARGLTLLLVEHDMHFIMRLCDQITVLNFGAKIAEGTPTQVRQDPRVIEAYLGAKVARGLESLRQ